MEGRHQRVLNDLWRTSLSRRYDLAPPPPPPPLSVSKFSLFFSLPICPLSSLLTGEGGLKGVGGGAISYDGEKAWSSINHSILSDNRH
jgi:hypothetical protein